MQPLQTISYATLKQWEADEWQELDSLRKIEGDLLKEGNIERYNIVHLSAQYQLGRWGIITELIDMMKGEK